MYHLYTDYLRALLLNSQPKLGARGNYGNIPRGSLWSAVGRIEAEMMMIMNRKVIGQLVF